MRIGEVVFSGIGIVFLVLGYLIKYKENLSLINDYNENKVVDKDKFIKWIGNHYFLLGILSFVAAILTYIMPLNYIGWIGYVILLFIILIKMTVGSKKYYKY